MSRIKSVDVLRVIAIISVIVIHTTAYEVQSSPIGSRFDLATVVNQVARFAVPFFFVLSGYFWARRINDEQDVYRPTLIMAKRTGFLLLAWSAIYLLPTNLYDSFRYGPAGPFKQIYWNMVKAVSEPLVTLMRGTKMHLWFLVGLLCSLLISAVFVRYKRDRLLVVLAVALFLVGLAGKAYSATPLGFHAEFNFRDGPFFALIVFVTGYFLYRRKPSSAWFPVGVAIAVFGLALHFTELWMLSRFWGTPMRQDYVVGTYFMGLGTAMMALSDISCLRLSRVASIGPWVLGIYVSHFVLVDLLSPLNARFTGNWLWEIAYVVAVFVLSCALVSGLSRFGITRRLVA